MDKKFMNKLDDMELDMVAGGRKKRVDGIKNGENHLGKKIENAIDSIAGGFKSFFNKFKPNLNPPTKCPL